MICWYSRQQMSFYCISGRTTWIPIPQMWRLFLMRLIGMRLTSIIRSRSSWPASSIGEPIVSRLPQLLSSTPISPPWLNSGFLPVTISSLWTWRMVPALIIGRNQSATCSMNTILMRAAISRWPVNGWKRLVSSFQYRPCPLRQLSIQRPIQPLHLSMNSLTTTSWQAAVQHCPTRC